MQVNTSSDQPKANSTQLLFLIYMAVNMKYDFDKNKNKKRWSGDYALNRALKKKVFFFLRIFV